MAEAGSVFRSRRICFVAFATVIFHESAVHYTKVEALLSRNVLPPEGSPVALHGQLEVKGNQIIDEHKKPVQLRGMSMFWSQEMGQFWNKDVIDWLVNDWKVSLVRAAMGIENADGLDGYLASPAVEVAKMTTVVDECIRRGIYVVIDWHDHHANMHVSSSMKFFENMSQTYGIYPNVLFEIWNEPEALEWKSDIKPYHETIVPVIRGHTDNIIILGTDTWSQGVDNAAEDPVNARNIAYTIHFYAASHKEANRKKAVKALVAGVALFATEWGTCDYSGNGTLDLDSSREWMKFFDQYHISSANWAVSTKYEACSALGGGASVSGGWQDSDLTASGYYVRNMLRDSDTGEACRDAGWPCVKEHNCASNEKGCMEEKCCIDPNDRCYEKNTKWAQCMTSCQPGLHMNDPEEYRTPWSCKIWHKHKGPAKPNNVMFWAVFAWAMAATILAVAATFWAIFVTRKLSRERGPRGSDEEGSE